LSEFPPTETKPSSYLRNVEEPPLVSSHRPGTASPPPVPVPAPIGSSLSTQWGMVDRGLGLLQWGVFFLLAALVVDLLFTGLQFNGPDPTSARGTLDSAERSRQLAGWLLLSVLPSLCGNLLFIVGRFQCALAPPDTGARSLARYSALLRTVAAGCVAGLAFLEATFTPAQLSTGEALTQLQFLAVGLVLAGGAGELLFLWYLSRIADFLNNQNLRRALKSFLVVLGLVVFAAVAGVCVLTLAFLQHGPPAGRGRPATPASPTELAGYVFLLQVAGHLAGALLLPYYVTP